MFGDQDAQIENVTVQEIQTILKDLDLPPTSVIRGMKKLKDGTVSCVYGNESYMHSYIYKIESGKIISKQEGSLIYL